MQSLSPQSPTVEPLTLLLEGYSRPLLPGEIAAIHRYVLELKGDNEQLVHVNKQLLDDNPEQGVRVLQVMMMGRVETTLKAVNDGVVADAVAVRLADARAGQANAEAELERAKRPGLLNTDNLKIIIPAIVTIIGGILALWAGRAVLPAAP